MYFCLNFCHSQKYDILHNNCNFFDYKNHFLVALFSLNIALRIEKTQESNYLLYQSYGVHVINTLFKFRPNRIPRNGAYTALIFIMDVNLYDFLLE